MIPYTAADLLRIAERDERDAARAHMDAFSRLRSGHGSPDEVARTCAAFLAAREALVVAQNKTDFDGSAPVDP